MFSGKATSLSIVGALMSTQAVAFVDEQVIPPDPSPPEMTSFYLECMKAGGIPGNTTAEQRFFRGARYIFQIWTPRTSGAGGGSFDIGWTDYDTQPVPTQGTFSLESGEAVVLITDRITFQRSPQGNGPAMEYCVRMQPVIELNFDDLPISIGQSQTVD